MSAIDNSEFINENNSSEQNFLPTHIIDINKKEEKQRPKRILHFSDGTLEESDTDYEDDQPSSCSTLQPEPEVPIDPKTLSWPGWFQYHALNTGSKTLNYLDYAGETLAHYLGVTSSKYQYEIDEYNRTKQEEFIERKRSNIELESWATSTTRITPVGQSTPIPIVRDLKPDTSSTVILTNDNEIPT